MKVAGKKEELGKSLCYNDEQSSNTFNCRPKKGLVRDHGDKVCVNNWVKSLLVRGWQKRTVSTFSQ